MRRILATPFALLLLTVPLAGCLELFTGGDVTSEDLSLARVITLDLGPDDFQSGDDPDFEELLETTLVVVALQGSHDVAGLTVQYTDRDGDQHEAPLSDFTDRTTLAAGETVEIERADLKAPSSLTKDGTVVVSRGLRDAGFWHVGDVPVGFGMEPGTNLVYDITSSTTGEFAVEGITTPLFILDRAEEIVGMTLDGTLTMSLADAAQTGPFGSGLEAPFALDLSGTFPIEASGRGTYNGSPFDVGFALEDTEFDVHADVAFWVDDDGSIQGVDPGDASVHVDATPIVWINVDDPNAATEPCYGATRADRCDPFEDSEFGLPFDEEAPDEEPVPADVPEVPEEDQDDLALWTAFLQQGLAVGDAIHVVLHGTGEDLGAPGDGEFELRYDVEVTGLEEADVAAGTYDAYEVLATATLRGSTDDIVIEGAPLVDAFEMEETLQRTTMWFEEDTLLLLRFEQTFPADIQRMLDTMISAINLEQFAGEDAGEVEGPESITAVADSRLIFELSEYEGRATMSPLFAYGLFQAGPMWAGIMLPFMLGGMPFGGYDDDYYEPYPEWMDDHYADEWNETPREPYPKWDDNVTGEFSWGAVGEDGYVPVTLVSGGPFDPFTVSAWFEGETQSFPSDINDAPGLERGGWMSWDAGQTRYLRCRVGGPFEATISRFGEPLTTNDVVCPDMATPTFTVGAAPTGVIPVTLVANGPATWIDTNVWVSGPGWGNMSVFNDASLDESWIGDDWLNGQTKFVPCAGSGPNEVEVTWASLAVLTTTVECP